MLLEKTRVCMNPSSDNRYHWSYIWIIHSFHVFWKANICVFSQGDACTSCPSLSTGLGDGVAVPGPKGAKGEPGSPGEGKPGRNVKKLCSFFFTCSWELLIIICMLSSQGQPGLQGVQGPVGPKGSKVWMFISFLVYKCILRIVSVSATLPRFSSVLSFASYRVKLELRELASQDHK